MSIDKALEAMHKRIESKYWDYPLVADEMRITSYDAGDNPLIVEYYRSNRLLFTHDLTYDGSGRIIIKKLITP